MSPTLAAIAAAVCGAAVVVQLGAVTRPAPRTGPARRWGGAPAGAPAIGVQGRRRDVLVAVVAGCLAAGLAGLVPGAVCAAVGATVSMWLRARSHTRDAARRERAMPALARALADALRGGASVRGAIEAAAHDRSVSGALRTEVEGLARAVSLGTPLEAALAGLATSGGTGLRLLSGTVAMHLEAGGALAGALVRLAADGELAARIDEDRVSATAQARATVRVVAALPVLALLGAELATGNFIGTIAASPPALALLLLGFGLEVAAILAARAIVGAR